MRLHRTDRELDPSSPAWQEYYDVARRRRRDRRKHRRRRDNKKHRRALELAMVLSSVAVLGVLLAVFRSVLSR